MKFMLQRNSISCLFSGTEKSIGELTPLFCKGLYIQKNRSFAAHDILSGRQVVTKESFTILFDQL